MNIYFGENIKRLRKERELTQEALADFLGVSFQTISKWERGETYPDITSLPTIASFFNVSVDELLGIDKSQKEEKINNYLQLYETMMLKDSPFLFKKFQKAVKEFPGDFRLLVRYMHLLMNEGDIQDEKVCQEIMSIYTNIQNHCSDDSVRIWSKRLACQHLTRKGCYTNDAKYHEQAEEILDEMPSLQNAKEYLSMMMSDSAESHRKASRTAVEELMYMLDNAFAHYCYYEKEFSPEYKIGIISNMNNLFNMIYDDGNYGKNWMHLVYNYGHLGHLYFETGDNEKALEYLKIAAEYAIKCDAISNNTETVAKYYEQEKVFHEMKMCMRMKELMTKHYPLSDEFKSKPDFKEIIKMLET